MKLKFLFLFFPLLICNYIFAQGLVFDSISFNQQNEFPVDRAALPDKISLENYLPYLYPQTGSTCVAMSVALARTIMFAKSRGITDIKLITQNQMSPFFIYYLGRDEFDYSCNKGMNPVTALSIAQKIGFEKMSRIEYPNYWPYTKEFLCPNSFDFIPPEKQNHFKNASLYKIKDFYVTKSIAGIKTALSKGYPVIVAMQIPSSFENCTTNYWKSNVGENRNNSIGGHAMVAVGYDDNIDGGCIRIANSWGTKWGDNGKIWIPYNEFQYWLDGAFLMTSNTNSYGIENSTNLKSSKLPHSRIFKASEFNGKFDFNNSDYIHLYDK